MEMKGKKKILWRILMVILVLLVTGGIAAAASWNHLLNYMGDPEETVETLSEEALEALLGTAASETTSPDETWPEVNSSENITNIMLVGQNWREDEQNKLSDTMILCSINRETNTMTMVSILRDLYVPLPAYAGHGPGRNRINVCYALGSSWTGTSQGGMEMLAECVEQNFGVHVDHTIEVGFDTFVNLIDVMGGVEIEVTEEEARYMTEKVGYIGDVAPGLQTLNGSEALAYARIRKIDSDRQRAQRQRSVITSLLDKCRNMRMTDLLELAKSCLPYIITDMTNLQVTRYLWELIPMLKDLKLESVTIPVDNETLPGSMWGKTIDLYGYQAYVVECNRTLNGEYLRERLGIEETEE